MTGSLWREYTGGHRVSLTKGLWYGKRFRVVFSSYPERNLQRVRIKAPDHIRFTGNVREYALHVSEKIQINGHPSYWTNKPHKMLFTMLFRKLKWHKLAHIHRCIYIYVCVCVCVRACVCVCVCGIYVYIVWVRTGPIVLSCNATDKKNSDTVM